MEYRHICQAISDAENGKIYFMKQHVICFLWQEKWYPLRATIKHALSIAQENPPCDITTNTCLHKFKKAIHGRPKIELRFSNNAPTWNL